MNKQFFEKIFPSQGNLCIAAIRQDGVTIPRFPVDIDAALVVAQNFIDQKHNVYFTPGTYSGNRRRQVECLYVKAFFLDLDVEHGKNRYASKSAAVEDVQRLCQEINWPIPVLIDSGGGIHAYWILNEALPASEWDLYASAFKQLVIDKGMVIDEAVPADSARLMRVPGTSNYRYDPPTASSMLTDVYTYDFAELKPALGNVEKPFSLRDVEKGLDDDTKAIYDKRNGNFEFDFNKIAVSSLEENGCAQIKYILENAAECPEPLWYAGISVAVRCRDGESAIHQMSEDYPQYSFDETVRKADQSLREASWAHGCDAFAKENRSACEGCAYRGKITGPIDLGKILKTSPIPVVDELEFELAPETEDEAEPIRRETSPEDVFFPDYLAPYGRGINGGIYYTPPPRRDKKGKLIQDDPELLTPNDVYPIKRIYSPHDGECLLMFLRLPRDASREFLLPLRDVASLDKLRAVLASNGVVFEPVLAPKLASYLMKWTAYLMETGRADVMRVQQGWTEDLNSFLVGTREITAGEERYCPPSSLSKGVVRHIHEKGSYETWRQAVQMFGDPGYELHAFTVLCGLASPLMELSNVNGVTLSLYSEGPGTGKTGALYGALSIWGNPEQLSVYEGTSNGLVQRMITSKNIVYGLDEQGNLKPEVVSPLLYNISSGKSKIRLMASNNQEREASYNSRLIAVMTTNKPMRGILAEHKANNAAENVRLLEPEVLKPEVAGYELTAARGVEMFEPLKYNYGHAGPLYMKEIFRLGVDEVRSRAKKEYLRVAEKYSSNAEYRFLSNLVSLPRVAGEIANSMGMLNYDLERIFSVIGRCFDDVIAGKRADDENNRSDTLGDFINKNIQSCLVVRDGKVTTEPRGPLLVRAEVDNGLIYVSTSAMKQYLKEIKMDIKQFESRLSTAGILKDKVRKQMASGWRDALGSTNVQAYEITMDVSHLFQNEETAPTTEPVV
jgi:hypothetical protein